MGDGAGPSIRIPASESGRESASATLSATSRMRSSFGPHKRNRSMRPNGGGPEGEKDAHECHLGEVVPLGDDLRAYEDVHLPPLHPGEDLPVETLLPAEVRVEPRNPGLLPPLRGPRDQPLRADPDTASPPPPGRASPRPRPPARATSTGPRPCAPPGPSGPRQRSREDAAYRSSPGETKASLPPTGRGGSTPRRGGRSPGGRPLPPSSRPPPQRPPPRRGPPPPACRPNRAPRRR